MTKDIPTVLTAKIEQIVYNGPVEYSHDFRWVVRDTDGVCVCYGESSTIGWATIDCPSGVALRFPNGDYTLNIDFDGLPNVIDAGNYSVEFGLVSTTGPTVPWPDGVVNIPPSPSSI